ncbi:hypothetical protein OIU78_022404 [Salix suchowensis]|nr:hypothetical protein OIU78_022404 [Salix suchowensis]
MAAIQAAFGDAVLTFMWVFVSSMFGLFTNLVVTALGLQTLGGASFNPTGTASFYAAGVGGDTLFSMALKFPAQAAGAVGGALAIMEVMPVQYKHMLGGPTLQVDLHTGGLAEGVLTFLMSFAVLVIILRGPRNPLLQTLFLAVATITLVVAGSTYTGPSMNPANVSIPFSLLNFVVNLFFLKICGVLMNLSNYARCSESCSNLSFFVLNSLDYKSISSQTLRA